MKSDLNQNQANDWPSGLPQPALRALASAGFVHLEQLTGVTEAHLLRLHGFGPKALGILRSALAARGLSFAGEPDGKKHAKSNSV